MKELYHAARNHIRVSLKAFFNVPEARRAQVREDISIGSAPRLLYYVLMGISALLASIGLVLNSAAVVIGAMLVSPLMTPIFGISLGLSRGNMRLLRHALLSEFGGILLAIIMAALFGLLPFSFAVTPEILARTSPTLLDLMVAAFAGLAGCLAMIDERISPVLPGIAMATSLTPPLAASGLCLALGAPQGAWGAFLLFFANFLAILVVATIIFLAAGFVTKDEAGSKLTLLRRFSAAIIGLLAVTILLTNALISMVESRNIDQIITDVANKAFETQAGMVLDSVRHYASGDNIDILVMATAPAALRPNMVLDMQRKMSDLLKLNATLVVRSSITTDVTSPGSAELLTENNLNGEIFKTTLSKDQRILQAANQALMNLVQYMPDTSFDKIEMIRDGAEILIVAHINNTEIILPEAISKVERLLRARLGVPNLRLVVFADKSEKFSSKGVIMLPDAHFGGNRTVSQMALQLQIEQALRREIEKTGPFFALDVDAVLRPDEGWISAANVVGSRAMTSGEVKEIERKVRAETGEAVTLRALSRVEVVVGDDGIDSLRDIYTKKNRKRVDRIINSTLNGPNQDDGGPGEDGM